MTELSINECLTERRVVIIHKKTPCLNNKDLDIYISILYETCELWAKYPDILEFKMFFPIETKGIIQDVLRNINSRGEHDN